MAKSTLYNATENTQVILLNGERTVIESGDFIEVEAKDVKQYPFLVSSKEHKEIKEGLKAKRSAKATVTVGDSEKVKTLEAQVAEMAAQLAKLTEAK